MNKDAIIEYRINKAKECIIEAEKMADIKHWNTCVNRLYYSCFYVVSALLFTIDLNSTKHSGIKGLFNLHFIKSGKLKKTYGRLYNKLILYRQQSDYEDMFEMEADETLSLLVLTKEFVDIIVKMIELP